MFKNINYFLTDSAENVLAAYKLRLDPGKDSGTENGFIFSAQQRSTFPERKQISLLMEEAA